MEVSVLVKDVVGNCLGAFFSIFFSFWRMAFALHNLNFQALCCNVSAYFYLMASIWWILNFRGRGAWVIWFRRALVEGWRFFVLSTYCLTIIFSMYFFEMSNCAYALVRPRNLAK